MATTNEYYQTKSAVLFIIFSRVDTSLQVLEQIKHAKPARLYITADAARTNRLGEDLRCAETRSAVMAAIDWDCEIKTLFRDYNLGPKEAISSAIYWFFEQEEEGIILEHDCLPANSFFMFCDTLLEYYRYDMRIGLISGSNLSRKKWSDASYYFTNLKNGWGLATWKRSWKNYNKDLTQYQSTEVKAQLQKIFDHPLIIDRWVEIFEDTKSGKIDTWDYQAEFAYLFNHCINIVPNNNLISNIGFGEGAENTLDPDSVFSNIPVEEITEIIHPTYILPEKQADLIVLMDEFKINEKIAFLKKHNSYRRQFKRWFWSLLK